MRRLLILVPLLVLGCSQKTPEEQEAAKYPPPSNMMSEAEGKKFMEGQKDPRTGGPPPATGP